MLIPTSQNCQSSNDNELAQNNSLEPPHLFPPPAKKPVLLLDIPPSPVPVARMSPKVAASLEKIDQLLAANPPLQHTSTVRVPILVYQLYITNISW